KQDNLKNISFDDEVFDAVLCFRFFHHLLTSEARLHVINELCRVSNKYVLISYLSPVSVTSFKRKVRVIFGGRKSSQQTSSLKDIKRYFHNAGYELEKDFAQTPILHTLHLAVFKRNLK
ncbi:MAG: class I SAM-dependent methyltransferase, partial [gamma proteobacterium symbiont of Bathyaustriella thionipta]|nr:class I SAM-dependent methyltransferase [gamma proteobacterium symbiont of Bathyaustriella thionipta]MCU7956442.1 class I SAM-dependent methyltransferase [gamma proteobacterium symbiont of Bathyaustriella thionipta]